MANFADLVELNGGSAQIGLLQGAAAALSREDDFYREVLQALPSAVYITDSEGRIQFFNEAAAALWGRRPALGQSEWCGSWRLFWPDGRRLPHSECPMAMALKERRPVRGLEAVAERPDGSRVPFLPFPTPIYDASGALIGAVNMLVDLTDLNCAQHYKQRLAAIIESSDDAIVSKDLNGVITSWNRGAERLFGYSAEEAIGKSVVTLIPQDRHDEEREILARVGRGERVDHYETVRQRKDGSLIEISLTVSPVRNREGRITGASKIARDITEQKRAKEKNDLLVGEIKHRIRNTMATVHAIAAQTLHGASREELAAFLARLQALARSHDQLTLENWNRTPLGGVVDQALAAFQDKNCRCFVTEGPNDILLDSTRATLLTMILHELATNAVKYGALSNGTGRVTASWKLLEHTEPPRFRLCWKEEGGPPVTPPQRKGFGSHLIERALSGAAGEARLEFAKTGVRCSLEMAI
jgi:PAS domain S-box-containing protein